MYGKIYAVVKNHGKEICYSLHLGGIFRLRRMLRSGFNEFLVEPRLSQLRKYDARCCIIFTEGYRSGHNEAVLKTVWVHAHVGSNPTPSAKAKGHLWVSFLFWWHGWYEHSLQGKRGFAFEP